MMTFLPAFSALRAYALSRQLGLSLVTFALSIVPFALNLVGRSSDLQPLGYVDGFGYPDTVWIPYVWRF